MTDVSWSRVLQDRCVVTSSWDRCVHVYNDKLELLRRVVHAHDTDIVSLAVSRSLCLIATGGAEGLVKLWDFQVCVCTPASWGYVCLLVCLFVG